MGPATNPKAVVDERLKVHGVDRLRVVDASVMPKVIAGMSKDHWAKGTSNSDVTYRVIVLLLSVSHSSLSFSHHTNFFVMCLGHTAAGTVMLAERAADLIKDDWAGKDVSAL